MNAAAGAEAWSLFWEEQGVGGGCQVTGDLLAELQKQWFRYALELPPDARVLDIACGAGAVGRGLINCRSDVRVVGVDSARVPVQERHELTLLSSIRMEALPFEDCSFDGAVSQFGIEYGNIVDTAPELARVLKPGALICFLAHHYDSKIACDGRMRHEALETLVSGSIKDAFLSGDRQRLSGEFAALARTYPNEGTIELARTYFERRLSIAVEERLKTFQAFRELLAPEISILGQLEESCLCAERLGRWLVSFLSRTFEIGVSVVRSGSGEPIVWKISGRR